MGKRKGAIAKISVPQLHGIVGRARLFDRIEQLRPGRTVWIAGPPGAGKTSLVASLVEARHPRALWYQVDGADADPAAFFYFLSLAAPGRRVPLPLLQPEYLPDLGGFAERFFRELFERLPAGAVLVLDN